METILKSHLLNVSPRRMSLAFTFSAGALLIVLYLFSSDFSFGLSFGLALWLAILTYVTSGLEMFKLESLRPYILSIQLSAIALTVSWFTQYAALLLMVPVLVGLIVSESQKSFVVPAVSGIILAIINSQYESVFTILLFASVFVMSVFVNHFCLKMTQALSLYTDKIIVFEKNYKKHHQFVNEMMGGKFSEKSDFSNDDTLGNALFEMGTKFRKSHDDEKIRTWEMTGLNELSRLIRQGGDEETSYRNILSFIVKYVDANQGGFFTKEIAHGEAFLELKACYAYDRHKVRGMKISFGRGLAGQCLADGEMTYLERIPENYIHITSGLGQATPTSLIVIPLKHNEELLGVIEMAFFVKLKVYEIEFLKKVSEILGSAISFNQKAASTSNMLHESMRLAAELREQQEETRQNLEELEATQESLTREAAEREKLQCEIEKSKQFLNLVIDSIPIPVFVKDRNHKMVLLNKAVCDLNNMSKVQMLGKSDYDFFAKEEADVFWNFEEDIFVNKSSAEKVEHAYRNGKETYTLDKKLFVSTGNGEDYLVGINIDITDSKMMEKRMQSVG